MQMNEVQDALVVATLPVKAELPIRELVAIVLGESAKITMKQLMLVGTGSKVGTSFISRHLASQLAPAFGRILLIEVRTGVRDEFAVTASLPGPLVTKVTMQPETCFALVARGRPNFPDEWLKDYGLIVWDVQPLSLEPVGLAMAAFVDSIVILAQANKTRRQVAIQTMQRLQDNGGRVMGVVLNRVKSYIPSWAYRLL
jgi:hypothetical protein